MVSHSLPNLYAIFTASRIQVVSIIKSTTFPKVWISFSLFAPKHMMAFTFSIANGIAFGFITYTVLKVGAGKSNEVSNGVWALTVLFIAKFIFLN